MRQRGPRSKPVWKSTSEFVYPENYCGDFVNLHAIEQMQLRGRRSRRWLGASEI